MRLMRLDSIPLSSTYFTEEGYFRDEPIVTSVGIFEYRNKDGGVRRELRLPENVFSKESLSSYMGKPVIITHNAGSIDKENVMKEIVGTILSDGYRDGDDVRCKIIIHNTDKVKGGNRRELSLGYSLELDETPGVWKGIKYDAIQKNIRINHLAIVDSARAGDQARLNLDGKSIDLEDNENVLKGGKMMSEKDTNAVGLTAEELDEAVRAYKERMEAKQDSTEEEITEVVQEKTDAEEEGKKPEDIINMVKEHKDSRPDDVEDTIIQQDEDIDMLIATLEKLLDDMKSKKSDSEDEPEMEEPAEENPMEEEKKDSKCNADSADDIIKQKLAICRIGDRLNMDGLEKMSLLDGKKAIINRVKPEMRLDGKSDTYINAVYDLTVGDIVSEKDVNYQRRQAATRTDSKPVSGSSMASDARKRMIAREGGKE